MYLLLATAWAAWALIGLSLGHLLVFFGGKSKAAILDFDGWTSPIASTAVLCVVAICLSMIVDHYDRRDNEHVYKQMRRALGWTSAGLFVIALLGKCALPSGVGFAGLLDSEELRQWVKPSAFGLWLRQSDWPWTLWLSLSGLAFFSAMLVSRLLKAPEDALISRLLGMVGLAPAFLLISATVVMVTFSGVLDPSSGQPSWNESSWRRSVALAWSALTLIALCWAFLLFALAVATARALRRLVSRVRGMDPAEI
jgi:hypothetical protein